MKVWIDILTPKQVLFFKPLIDRLNEMGVETLVTARSYRELNLVLKMKGVGAFSVGKHGGGSLLRKLLYSASRIRGLAKLIDDERVDLAVSYASVETARVAYGLGIPHYCVSDSPHAEAVSKLTIPLSQILFTPFIIPLKAWTKYGINPKRIVRYRALDPYVWITRTPHRNRGLTYPQLVTVRMEEEYASYLLGEGGNSITLDTLRRLTESKLGIDIVVLPRYRRQCEELKRRFRGKVRVYEKGFDGLSLIASSAVFIGAGGTMTAEAALLGTPCVSIYPGAPTYVEAYLIKEGLLVRRLNPDFVVEFVRAHIADAEARKQLRCMAENLLGKMEDPCEVIAQKIVESA